MSSNTERLFNALAADIIATDKLTSKDKETLARFDEILDALRDINRIPDGADLPAELIEEAFEMVPGSEQAIYKQTILVDYYFKIAEESSQQ